MHLSYDVSYLIAAPLSHIRVPRGREHLRITYIVEVDTVDVVVGCNLPGHGSDKFRGRLLGRVEEGVSVQLKHFISSGTKTLGCRPRIGSHRQRGYPRLHLHATLMAFGNSKGQWVVAGIYAEASRHTGVPRINGGGVDGRGTVDGLQKYRIDIGLLIFIKDIPKFLLLSGNGIAVASRCSGPV